MTRIFDKAKLPSRHVTEGRARAPHRSYYYAMGLTAEDIANTIHWIATLPAHLNINTLELMPVSQSWAGFAVARDEA